MAYGSTADATGYGATSKDEAMAVPAHADAHEPLIASESAPQPAPPSAGTNRIVMAVALTALAGLSAGAGVMMSQVNSQPTTAATPTSLKAQWSSDDDDPYSASLSNLTCNYFDDDAMYPNDGCNYGDSGVCESVVSSSEAFYETCYSSCDEGEMSKYEKGVFGARRFPNSSWAVVCGWESVKNLPSLCDGDFDAYLPTSAQNVDPTFEVVHERLKEEGILNQSYHGCNLHAFCVTCETTDENGVENYDPYCQAMTGFYGNGALYDLSVFFNHLDSFWCQDDVLDAIANDTFSYTYQKWDGSSAMPGSFDEKNSRRQRAKSRKKVWDRITSSGSTSKH